MKTTQDSKHTPGEWTVKNIGSNLYVQAGPDTDVCLVYRPYPGQGQDGSPEAQAAERAANARLIASAPAMLAERDALKSALSIAQATIERLHQKHASGCMCVNGTLDVIRAAIANANS